MISAAIRRGRWTTVGDSLCLGRAIMRTTHPASNPHQQHDPRMPRPAVALAAGRPGLGGASRRPAGPAAHAVRLALVAVAVWVPPTLGAASGGPSGQTGPGCGRPPEGRCRVAAEDPCRGTRRDRAGRRCALRRRELPGCRASLRAGPAHRLQPTAEGRHRRARAAHRPRGPGDRRPRRCPCRRLPRCRPSTRRPFAAAT